MAEQPIDLPDPHYPWDDEPCDELRPAWPLGCFAFAVAIFAMIGLAWTLAAAGRALLAWLLPLGAL